MFWEAQYPRLLTIDQMEELELKGKSRLLALGDITCDLEVASI